MNRLRLPTLRLIAILTTAALLNSGCDLLTTILNAVGERCATLSDITVTTTTDSNSGECTASNCSLRNAVSLSNVCPGTQVIHLPGGDYGLTITGANEDHNRTGDLDITDTVQIIAGSHRTIDGHNADRVLDIRPGVNVHISGGLIIQHGVAQGDSSDPMAGGGGIRNQGTLVMDSCSIQYSASSSGFSASGSGGGILSTGSLELNSCSLSHDQAGQGGGIAVLGFSVGVSSGSSLHMTNSSLSDNSSSNGGGLFLDANTGTELNNFLMDRNSAGTGYGGAVFIGAGELTLNQGELGGNQAARGGAIFSEGRLSATQVLLQNNTGNEGFAVFNEGTGGLSQSAVINNSYVSRADTNGAVENCGGPFSLQNTTISGNQGGGVNNPCGSANLNVSYSTIANNTVYGLAAGETGASSTTILNSIVAAVPGGISCFFHDPGVVVSGQDIDNSGGCHFHGTGDRLTDPGLLPLAMESGTYVHPLSAGSPAIDTADGSPSCPGVDQRGVGRPQGGGCDRGAYEVVMAHALVAATPVPPTVEATKSGLVQIPATTPITPGPVTLQLTLVQNANCRWGPGTAYSVLTSVLKDQIVTLSGRNDDNTWWFTVLPGNNRCWLSLVAGQPNGDTSLLPVMQAPPTPVPTNEPNLCLQYGNANSCAAAGCTWNPQKNTCH